MGQQDEATQRSWRSRNLRRWGWIAGGVIVVGGIAVALDVPTRALYEAGLTCGSGIERMTEAEEATNTLRPWNELKREMTADEVADVEGYEAPFGAPLLGHRASVTQERMDESPEVLPFTDQLVLHAVGPSWLATSSEPTAVFLTDVMTGRTEWGLALSRGSQLTHAADALIVFARSHYGDLEVVSFDENSGDRLSCLRLEGGRGIRAVDDADGAVYLTYDTTVRAQDSDLETEEDEVTREVVARVDVANGSVAWTKAVHDEPTWRDNLVSGAVEVSGDTVFVSVNNPDDMATQREDGAPFDSTRDVGPTLRAFSIADGSLLWERSPGESEISSVIGGGPEGSVIVQTITQSETGSYAYEIQRIDGDGKTMWSTPVQAASIYVELRMKDDQLLVDAASMQVHAFDVNTGAIRWTTRGELSDGDFWGDSLVLARTESYTVTDLATGESTETKTWSISSISITHTYAITQHYTIGVFVYGRRE